MKILFEDNHLLVVIKEPNIPMQEDESGDKDMLTIAKDYLREKYNKPGNIYVGMVHRLDRPVGGVIVLAKTSKAASRLSEQVRKRELDKIYFAVTQGNLPRERRLEDVLRKDKKNNTSKVVTADDAEGKEARLTFEPIDTDQQKQLNLIRIKLETGRSHQIRVQFAARNNPLWGDARYNSSAKAGQQIALWAVSLSFNHPVTQERMRFTSTPPSSFPWNLFGITEELISN